MKKSGKTIGKAGAVQKSTWEFPLEKKDMIFLLVGIGVIVLGYLLMTTGITEDPAVIDGKWNNPLAVTVAPMLLVIGYCVIIPMAILKFFSKSNKSKISETIE